MITYPKDGATVSGSITITVDASDNVAVSKVELYIDGTLFAVDFDAPYEFYWDTNNNQDGVHTLQAKAYDTSNNVGESNIVSVSVNNQAKDTKPPTLSIISPQNGSTISGTIYIQASAWDESGISKIEFYINGKLVATDGEYPYAYRWNTRSVKDGWHTITVKAYDVAGNSAEASIRVYVSNRK